MKAWRVSGCRDIAGLRIETVARPQCAPDEVHVAIAYAAVNFADGLMVRGRYQVRPELPFTPGFEVSGTVLDAGSSSGFAPGDRVCGQVAWGGYAQEVSAPAARWMHLPEGADLASAAALPVSYITAHIALFDSAKLRPDDTLVVLAAAGGVGRAAIELAAGRSGPTIALVGSEAKRGIALAAGASHAINYRESDWVAEVRAITGGNGAHAVLDPVGGQQSIEAIRALAWRGKLLVVGFASGNPAALPANRLLVKAATASGIFWSHDKDGVLLAKVQAELMQAWRAGRIRPLISGIHPFDDLREAIAEIESGGTVGKLLLAVGGGDG
ncbi:MAG TPA: NADPH:quinone oxidoreductase family protein [Sphingopyxis sp.]|nr:NADPH:quinone oxidoreductase family protein [Sphingopyxis sp.]